MTLLDLLTLSYADLGVDGAGQTLPADLASIGMKTANSMFDAMTGQRNFLYAMNSTVQPFTVGTWQYPIGPTADTYNPEGYNYGQYNQYPYNGFGDPVTPIVQPRPVQIQTWSVLIIQNSGPYPLELTHQRTLSADEYNLYVSLKTLPSTFPTALYYNPLSPNGVLNFWPVPSQGGYSMVLYWPQGIDQLSSLTDVIEPPPGYIECFEYCLVERLAPKVGRSMTPELIKLVREAKGFLKARNQYVPQLDISFNRWDGMYNWLTDEQY